MKKYVVFRDEENQDHIIVEVLPKSDKNEVFEEFFKMGFNIFQIIDGRYIKMWKRKESKGDEKNDN